jgi:uroporphyrinogen decarboxylase
MMSTLTTAVGMTEAMLAYYQDRTLLDALLQCFGDYFQVLTRAILEHGAPVVFVSWHNLGVSAGWSPAIWLEAFEPWIAANVDLVHSYGALYNYFDNGPVAPLLADLAEIGPDIVSTLCPPPLGDVDLSEAKRTIGDQVCLHGNVDAIHIVQKGTPDQVRQAVREAIRVAAPGGGYILGNSDCFFDSTPRKNIEAFFAAAREFGRYPVTLR